MKIKTAVLQLNTTKFKEQNLIKISRFIKTAAENGAKLISLPEYMNVIGGAVTDDSEDIPGETTELLISLSRQHNIWIHGGSIVERNRLDGSIVERGRLSGSKVEQDRLGGKPYNTTVMISPECGIAAKYSKLHLFDANIEGGVNFKESDRVSKGDRIVVIDTAIGRLGFSICYDLRFPELYRSMALLGAQIVFVPANYTHKTGNLHWEVLLRCRAIENNCFIIAADQCGENEQFRAYGHSMVVNPNGKILAELNDDEGIAYAEIDLNEIDDMKRQIPSLMNRRYDIYGNLSLTRLYHFSTK